MTAYTLADADEGAAVKVRVSFQDDAGNPESLTGAATEKVAPRPPLTATFGSKPSAHDGQTAFTFEPRFSEEFGISYLTLWDHAFKVTGGTVNKAKRITQGSNIGWTITVTPGSAAAAAAVRTADGRKLSNRRRLKPLAGRGADPESFGEASGQQEWPDMRKRRGSFRRPEPTRLSLPAFSPEALLALNQHMRRSQPREEAGEMRRKRPARPRVILNRDAVWELLDELGISQNELARLCGLSPGYMSLLMAGKRSPSPRTRRRLMQALGVSEFEDLFIWETGEDQD